MKRVRIFIATMFEALTRLLAEYKDLAAAQRGELRWYGVGIWLRGLGNREREVILEAFGPRGQGQPGWWDSAPSRRDAWFFVMAVESATPELAAQRCLGEMTRRFEDAGVRVAEAVRVEAEPLPKEHWPEQAGEREAA